MIITNYWEVRRAVDELLEWKQPIAFDIETTGLSPWTSKLVSLQLHQEDIGTFIVDMRGFNLESDRWDDKEVWAGLRDSLQDLFDGRLLVMGHNLMFDTSFLLVKFGIRADRLYDTMLAEQVIYGADNTQRYGLKDVCERRGIQLDAPMDKADREWFYSLDEREDDWNAPFPAHIERYMENDVRALPQIFKQQHRELKAKGLIGTAQLEFKCLPAIREIECNGVPINVEGWSTFIAEKAQAASAMKEQVIGELGPYILKARGRRADEKVEVFRAWEEARDLYLEALKQCWEMDKERTLKWGDYKNTCMKMWREDNPRPENPKEALDINIDSNQQLIEGLLEMGVEVPRNREGKQSVDDEALEKLEVDAPVIGLLRSYRREEKFVKSYGETLLAEQNPVTGRFHFRYKAMVRTGRMSASRIQQLPKRGEGERLRSNVQAPEGKKLITCDFNAIEMRIIAEQSGDEGLIQAFKRGEDIHTSIAKSLFRLGANVDAKHTIARTADGRELGDTYRGIAKVVEYATVYGAGAAKIAQTIGSSVEDAKEILRQFREAYPRLAAHQERVKANALACGETRTIGGRARYYHLPTKPENPTYAERRVYEGELSTIKTSAGNAPIQGTSADITKLALVKFYEYVTSHMVNDSVKIIACVHDEIVVECYHANAEEYARILERCMEEAAAHYLKRVSCPCKAEVSNVWEK